jgi:hypothetical protein
MLKCNTIPAFSWRDLGKPRKALLRRADIPAEIRNEYLPITSQARYRYDILFFHSSMALQPFVGPRPLLQFHNLFCTDGRTPWTSDQLVARPLPTHRTTQTQNKRTQTSMPWAELEPTIPAFERVKTVHASDRAATVIGLVIPSSPTFKTTGKLIVFSVRFSERRWERSTFLREWLQALLVKPALNVTLGRESRRGWTANARSSILGTFPANVRHGYERGHTTCQFPLLIFQRSTKKKVRLFNFLFLNHVDTISHEYACNPEREDRLRNQENFLKLL